MSECSGGEIKRRYRILQVSGYPRRCLGYQIVSAHFLALPVGLPRACFHFRIGRRADGFD
jgi:hypothetical protein